MIKNICLTALLLLTFNSLIAQDKSDLYVVLPAKFDFLKYKDSYRVNTLARYLFKQEGYDVYFDDVRNFGTLKYITVQLD